MRHLGQAFARELHSNSVAGSCQEPSEVRGEMTIHRGPCCPAQMSPILPAFLRLRKAHTWRMGAEGGSRRRATGPGLGRAPPGLLQDPCRREAGPGEPPRQCVCLSSLFRFPADRGKRLIGICCRGNLEALGHQLRRCACCSTARS